MPVARAGRGIEAIVGIGEDAEPAAQRVLARMRDPLVVDLTLSGSALTSFAPRRLPDLFGGSPARIAVELKPEGGELVIAGRTVEGPYRETVTVAPAALGSGNDAVARLFARERVEDLETDVVAGGAREELERAIERMGLDHQISTRLTSFVAITDDPTVDPNDPMRRETMPQALPFGMSAEGLGLRSAGPQLQGFAQMAMPMAMDAFAGSAVPPQSRARAAAPSPMGMGAPQSPPPPPGGFAPSFGRPPAPSAPAPASAPPKGGVLAKLGRLISGPSSPERGAPPPPAPARRPAPTETRAKRESAAEPEAAPPPHVPMSTGKIVLKQGNRLVVEITVARDGFELPIADLVAHVIPYGMERAIGKIDLGKSTRAGKYDAGMTLRIVIDLDGIAATDIHAVELWRGGEFLVNAE
jgi:Ca-activated chloride channel family protein